MLLNRAAQLDLSFLHDEFGKTDVECYLVFLDHVKKTGSTKTPLLTQRVDCVWHAHILHTKRYAQDCEWFFGYFLHHTPNEAPPKPEKKRRVYKGRMGKNGGYTPANCG